MWEELQVDLLSETNLDVLKSYTENFKKIKERKRKQVMEKLQKIDSILVTNPIEHKKELIEMLYEIENNSILKEINHWDMVIKMLEHKMKVLHELPEQDKTPTIIENIHTVCKLKVWGENILKRIE